MSKIELRVYFEGKHRAGSPGYYAGRPRGHVAVWHDSYLYLYAYPPMSMRADMKLAISLAFCTDGERVTGSWPEFTIKP